VGIAQDLRPTPHARCFPARTDGVSPGPHESAYRAAVEPRQLLDELFRAARKLAIEVRVEPFSAPAPKVRAGGVCRLRGRAVILIDAMAGSVDQALAMAEALAEFDLGSVALLPEAKRLVESALARAQWREQAPRGAATPVATRRDPTVRPLPRPKPGLRRTRPTGR
jgi:hypothetical protein